MKNSNSQMRLTDSNGISRVIHSDGTILASDNRAENLKKVRSITFGNQENEETLTHQVNQTAVADDDTELLLPVGFKMLANGTIETPEDRAKKVEPVEKKTESQTNSTEELLLPVGMKLES